jgi:peroxiredoxin Q/BCP
MIETKELEIQTIDESSSPFSIKSIKGEYISTQIENFNFNNLSLQGKTVVLYFYPKDNTPGCTTQATDFRDMYQTFLDKNVVILGISRDNLKSHNNFTQKFGLPFNLICDTEETLCNQFEVIKQKKMYGKTVRGIQRSTFVFDRNGKLIHVWRNVKAANHAIKLLEIL